MRTGFIISLLLHSAVILIAVVGLPSLVATLATMIMYRGLARVLLEDRSIGQFAEWFDALGQQPLVGPLPLAMILFFAFVLVAIVLLQYSGFSLQLSCLSDLFLMLTIHIHCFYAYARRLAVSQSKGKM